MSGVCAKCGQTHERTPCPKFPPGFGDTTSLRKRLDAAEEALAFYANPETYIAIGFFPDPPCGEFMDDFSDAPMPEYGLTGHRPGKLAREYFAEHFPTKETE